MAFSPDNTRLISGAAEDQALVWELAAGKLIEVVPAAGLGFAAYGADANTVLVGLADKTIRVETLHFERRLEGNVQRITGLVYSNDGGQVCSARTRNVSSHASRTAASSPGGIRSLRSRRSTASRKRSFSPSCCHTLVMPWTFCAT